MHNPDIPLYFYPPEHHQYPKAAQPPYYFRAHLVAWHAMHQNMKLLTKRTSHFSLFSYFLSIFWKTGYQHCIKMREKITRDTRGSVPKICSVLLTLRHVSPYTV